MWLSLVIKPHGAFSALHLGGTAVVPQFQGALQNGQGWSCLQGPETGLTNPDFSLVPLNGASAWCTLGQHLPATQVGALGSVGEGWCKLLLLDHYFIS